MTAPSKTSNNEKHVSFDEEPAIVEDKTDQVADDESEQDVTQTWYTNEEYTTIRNPLNEEDELGNEEAYSTISKQRAQAQREFVRSFLVQQNEHKLMGVSDPRGLYQFSKSVSKYSKKRALSNAKSVERECVMSRDDLVNTLDFVLDILGEV